MVKDWNTGRRFFEGSKLLGIVTAFCLKASVALALVPPGAVQPASSVETDACRALDGLGDGRRDASLSFEGCLASKTAGAVMALAPGRYRLTAQIVLDRPITITTRGVARAAPSCEVDDRRCATLLILPSPRAIGPGEMPVTVRTSNVALDHIIIKGGGNAALCLDPARRPSAGGLRVSGDDFALTRSALVGFACYTSLEYKEGARGRIERNLFANNGDHASHMMWSDGLTVHGASQLQVIQNRFVDNTDVQLIFGGCTDCTVANNSFRHTGPAAGGSFAELMIQAWPHSTTGRYDGTRVVNNDIDCGAQRRCGFGLMIGGTPWYDGPTSGGSVTGNSISNALLPINIDGLTGQMVIAKNRVVGRPAGHVPSSCGPVDVNGVINISPSSRLFLRGDTPTGATTRTFKGCLLNPS